MMGIQKKYMKSGSVCKVTFALPKDAAKGAQSVNLVGDFNNWDTYANPMKSLKNGEYKLSLNLESGKEYRFRYLINGNDWENDWDADKYVKNEFGSDDSVVVV